MLWLSRFFALCCIFSSFLAVTASPFPPTGLSAVELARRRPTTVRLRITILKSGTMGLALGKTEIRPIFKDGHFDSFSVVGFDRSSGKTVQDLRVTAKFKDLNQRGEIIRDLQMLKPATPQKFLQEAIGYLKAEGVVDKNFVLRLPAQMKPASTS
ncbi:hypothetical protein GYMLUDRAFT_56331 [Collybiopsis luxurians FD-317 M1]|nr:hypothetical protein GYMLUDRAFT_56331 [Collybiopsis luxurians FD-317 M1]